MSKTKTAIVGLALIFGVHATPEGAFAGDVTPDEAINFGVSVRQIDGAMNEWMKARFLQDEIYNKQPVNYTTSIETLNSFNTPGTGNSVAIGQLTDIEGCNGDANCKIMATFKDSTVEASNNNLTSTTTNNNPTTTNVNPAPRFPAK